MKRVSSPSTLRPMNLLDREFADLGELLIERDSNGSPIEFTPQARYGKAEESSLHRYGAGKFCKFRVTGLPGSSGVYLLASDGTVVYVGRAVNLQKRFSMGYGNISPKNCYQGGQQTNCRINQLVLQAAKQGKSLRIFIHECQDQESFEARLIAHLKPEWNRT